ncbi:MAG TPA: ester cyclase [Steroidobacteraceae bacterium]|jgi:predicted SnoaL-like aldol condensation-catalyzing enzyme|nr:ester cyclase [Steroidobacteraceae bacterium]
MTRARVLWLILTAAAVSGCSTPRFVIEAENARTNTHIVLAFEETVFSKHHVREGFSRYVAPEYKEHDPAFPGGQDEAARGLVDQLTNEYPDSRVVVKRTVAQRDLVSVHAFWDQKPGATRGLVRVDIYRLVNARIVEHWVVEQAVPSGSDAEAMF